MSASFLLMLLVAMPCAFVLGVLVGYGRGRRDAERDFVDVFEIERSER